MSLATNVQNLATRVATEFKTLRGVLGSNAALTTTAKGTIVEAINEVNAKPTSTGGAVINDAAVNTTQTWSSSKSTSAISAAVAGLVGTAPETLDTLKELSDALGGDANFATTVTNQIAGKADTVHTHTASQISDASTVGRSVLTAATAAAARTAIGAGTSSLVVGTTSGTAKDGAYQPTAANISDASATGRSVLTAADAAAARTAIGAGTGSSNLAIGTTASTAKAGNYAPAAADISNATAVGRSVLTATDAAAARTAIGAGTGNGSSNLVLGTTTGTAKDGAYQPTAANISDASTVGRSVLTAADAAAARTAIGAGTGSSNLALGTTSTTAKRGDYAPASTDISDASATGRGVLTAATALAARTTLDVYSKAEIGDPETNFVSTFEAGLV